MGHHHAPVAKSPQEHRLHRRKAQILPWIADPLKHFLHNEHKLEDHQPGAVERTQSDEERKLKKIAEEVEAEEATPIELFYDLFFVANLTTITSVHFMTSKDTVFSYIQFFILLWFTWIQTTFYDVRFSVDSVYERVIKALHFGVMFGFSSCSTQWNPLDPADSNAVQALKVMTLTLCVSRFALGLQYLVVMLFSKKHGKATVPLAIHAVVMFVSGIVNLSLYFKFKASTDDKSFVVWYGMILFEVVGVIATSSVWKVVSFKTTHLVERLGLLTLIIIGEGIIVMCKAVNSVEKGLGWSGEIFGIVFSSGLILYLFWMYYFDYTPAHSHYGTVRQQVWAVLHFPFHLGIVLSVEGLRQFTTFYSFLHSLMKLLLTIPIFATDNPTTDDLTTSVQMMAKYVQDIYDKAVSKTIIKNYDILTAEFSDLMSTKEWTDAQIENFTAIFYDLTVGFAEDYGIKMPKIKEENIDYANPLGPPLRVFDLVFRYFHVAIGVVFVFYAIFGLFVRRGKDVWDYISISLRFITALAMFSILAVTKSPDRYESYLLSAWPVPTICLVMFFPLVFDKAIGFFAFKRAKAAVKQY